MASLPPALQNKLTQVARALRLWRGVRALLGWVALCTVVFGALVAACTVASLSPAAHLVVTRALPAVALALGAAWVWRATRRPDAGAIARLVERRFPDLQDRLLAVVSPAQAEAGRVSAALTQALAAQVTRRLERENTPAAVSFGALRPVALAAAVCALTAALLVVTCPEGLARLLTGPERAALAPERPAVRRASPPDLTRVGIFDLSVEVAPPAYTGLAGRVVSEDFDGLQVVRGTRLTIRARRTESAEAVVQVGAAPPVEVAADGANVRHAFTAMQDVSWQLTARLGERQAAVGPYRVRVTADRPPRVRIEEPGRDLRLDRLEPLRLVVTAEDDFGLAEVSLLYRRRGESTWRALPLGGGGREVSAAHQWDLAPMGLRAGEAVQYRARAVDNDAVSGAKAALTRIYEVALAPTEPPPRTPQKVQEAHEAQQDALDQLRAEALAFDRHLQELITRARAAETSGQAFEFPRGALQEAKQRLEGRAQQARDAMAAAEQSLAENPLVTDDLLQKVQELHRLMAEALSEDMRAVMERVQEALQQTAPQEIRMSLEQAREAQRRFMEKLDRTLELLRRAKLEAELEALKRFAEDLAERQEKLGERTDRLSEGEHSDRETREQERLAEDTSPLAEHIRAVAEEMSAENESIAADLRNLAGEVERADPAGEMRRAAGALERGRPRAARAPQDRAAEALRDAAGRLSTAASDITAADRRAMTNAAHQLAGDAVRLSRSQEGVVDDTRELAAQGRVNVIEQKTRLTDIKRRQDAVRRGTEGLAGRLRGLAGRTPQVDPELASRAAELAAGMSRAAAEVEAGQAAPALARATEAMGTLNRLAHDLLQLAEQLDQSSARQALQEHLRRLEQLAERQRELNRQTPGPEQGGDQQGPAGQEGGMPLPGGAGGLGDLALEQALIRQALEELLSGRGAGGLTDQLGDVPGDMEQVEDDLQSGQVSAQTSERQRDILRKMLDAQRSLYSKQEESPQRKAEAPRPYSPPTAPPALRPDQTRPVTRSRDRRDMGPADMPLDFETITQEYLRRVRR